MKSSHQERGVHARVSFIAYTKSSVTDDINVMLISIDFEKHVNDEDENYSVIRTSSSL